jgi:hypothetical protein
MNFQTHRQHMQELRQLNKQKWNKTKQIWRDENTLQFEKNFTRKLDKHLSLTTDALDQIDSIFKNFTEEFNS